ncbi:MAG: HD domain-containing protein [Candidatus Altiarchaeota archaeon]
MGYMKQLDLANKEDPEFKKLPLFNQRSLTPELVKEVENIVKERLADNPILLAHTLLARDRSLQVADSMGLSVRQKHVVEVGALLHDISYGKCHEEGTIPQHEKFCSAEAEEILKGLNVRDDVVDLVKFSILNHNVDGKPGEHPEAVAVYDGDRLAFLENPPLGVDPKNYGYKDMEELKEASAKQLITEYAKDYYSKLIAPQ